MIEGKKHILSNRKYCLDCSPFGGHNTRKLHGQEAILLPTVSTICIVCGRTYQYHHAGTSSHSKTKCNSCTVNVRRFTLKQKSVDYKGGKCEKCGYNRCTRALSFHHINAVEKDFTLSSKHCYAWKRIQAELDKCILLCANCHMEAHNQMEAKTEESKFWTPRQLSTVSNICEKCGGKKTKKASIRFCHNCMPIKTKIVWPTKEELEKSVWKTPTSQLAKLLGVSDGAIGKRCKRLGIIKPGRGYWMKQK